MSLKSPFDKNVVCHQGLMEHMLDYSFAQLGNCGTAINHPVFMTEPLCNPQSARGKLSELLFECYQVPSVAYGVDSLLSFYRNSRKSLSVSDYASTATGLVVSVQHAATYVYPVLNGKLQFRAARRLDVGGARALEQLQKTLQLKYPYLRHKFTAETTEEMLHRFAFCATNFDGQLRHLEKRYEEQMAALKNRMQFMGTQTEEEKKRLDPPKALKVYRDQISYENEKETAGTKEIYENEVTVQLPYNPVLLPSEEEVKHRQEMRKEQGRRLKEYMQKKREEKKSQMTQEYDELKSIEKLKENDRDAFKECMLARGFEKYEELRKRIRVLAQKLGLKEEGTEKEEEEKYNLLAVPDDKLTPDQLKVPTFCRGNHDSKNGSRRCRRPRPSCVPRRRRPSERSRNESRRSRSRTRRSTSRVST